jgi:predicted MFS family arabinose efflux permease
MEMTSWDLYWITRLDDIKFILIATGVIGILGTFFFNIIDDRLSCGKPFIICIILFFFVGILGIATPTVKQIAAILILPKIINNQEIQKLPSNITNLANEWLEELRPKKEKK